MLMSGGEAFVREVLLSGRAYIRFPLTAVATSQLLHSITDILLVQFLFICPIFRSYPGVRPWVPKREALVTAVTGFLLTGRHY